MENYEELVGKEIIYKDEDGEVEAVVALIEEGIGITITSKDGKEYLDCLICKNSPKWNKRWSGLEEKVEDMFNALVKSIKTGVVDIVKIEEDGNFYSISSGEAGKDSCAFY